MTLSGFINSLIPILAGTGIGAAICSYIVRLIKKDILQQLEAIIETKTQPLKEESERNTAATTAALRYILKDMLQSYLQDGTISASDLDFVTALFQSYRDLGGNGIVQKLYNDVLQLPIN